MMGAPLSKLLIEDAWRERLFGAGWRPALGGGLDVIEPATGSVLTRVGLATPEDIRRAALEAAAAHPAWAATPYERRAGILRKAAGLLEGSAEELVGWIMRETGGIAPKAGFEIHMVGNILHRAAAMVTEAQGIVLPADGGRI